MAGPKKPTKSTVSSTTLSTSDSLPNSHQNSWSLALVIVPVVLAILLSAGLWQNTEALTQLLVEEQSDEMWKIADVGNGKGKGVIALRDITRGELVLRQTQEEMAGNNPVDASQHVTYSAAVNHGCGGSVNVAYHWRMPSPQANQPPKENEDTTQTNAESPDNDAGHVTITQPELRMYALKDINRGEELLGSYIDSRKNRAQRLDQLWNEFWFNCTCPVCSLPPDSEQSRQHDERLTKMGTLYQRFESWTEGLVSSTDAIQAAREIWALGEEESYFHDRGKLAEEAAYIAAIHHDAVAVREWTLLAYDWSKIEFGDDHERSVRCRQWLLKGPQSHFAWGHLSPQMVGGPDIDYDEH